jgi:hypothetical protein
MIPITAEQLYRQKRRSYKNAGTIQMGPGRPMFPLTTRPIIPAAPSSNWNYNEYHGFNGRGLNTYVIPPHQQKELALFSRYILKDPKATGTPLLERAQQRFQKQQQQQNRIDIKQYRTIMNTGGVIMNPSSLSEVR